MSASSGAADGSSGDAVQLQRIAAQVEELLDQRPKRCACACCAIAPRDRPWTSSSCQAGLSRKHFLRRFRRATGTSPIAFAIAARCRRAREMLAESDASVAAIAASLGYPDPFGFSRQFARVTGEPPSACRGR